MTEFFEIREPELFCSVGLLTGTGGAGRVSKQKQTSTSGTDLYKGLGQYDEFARSFGAAPSIANMDPSRMTQLPNRRFAQVGMTPPQPGQGGGAVTGGAGVPAATPQVNNPRANVAFAQQRQVQQGQQPMQRSMDSAQSIQQPVQISGPQYRTAFNPQGGVPVQGPNTGHPDYEAGYTAPKRGTGPYSYPPAPGQGPIIQYDPKEVQKQLKNQYGKGAEFYNVPNITYNPSPEELNFEYNEGRQQEFSQAGIPTAQRTQDYGDAFRLPQPESVFTPDVYEQIQNLGFTGQGNPVAEARGQYGDIAQSGAASAQAAQIGTGQQEFRDQSQRLYEAQFAPQQQELLRQQGQAERDQKARLASAGLATSGTGIAQQTELARDFGQRLSDTSRQAATQASAQAFGMQQEQRLQNAQHQQQTSLANAGFSQQAQLQNASNLLTRQGQVDQNYLAAIGMNQEQANGVRDDFLATLGLEAADLERVDAGQRQNVEMMFNDYINLLTTISNIGRYSTGSAVSTGPGGLITA